MTRHTTRAGRRWAWTAAILAGLVVAIWVFLALAFPPARMRALIERQLSGALTRDVRFTGAWLLPWPPVRLTVSEPELAEPGGFARGTAFRARAIHLDLDVLALLGRRVVVRTLVLDHPALHLVRRPDGSTNLDSLTKASGPSGGGRPMDLELHQLQVIAGNVVVDDVRAGRRIALQVDTRTSLAIRQSRTRIATAGTTRLSGLAFGPIGAARLDELNRSLAGLVWQIQHRGVFDTAIQRLALERLALQLGQAEIAFSGVVDRPGPQARFDLRARGSRVELAQVLQFLAAAEAQAVHGIQGSGRLDFDLGVKSGAAGRPPDFTGTLAIAEGAFRYPGAAALVRGLSLSATFAPDSLGIGNLSATVAPASGSGPALAPLRGSAVITRFQNPIVSFSLAGPVDLAAVGPLLAGKDEKLGGRADVALRGRGPAKDIGAMELEGRARLADVSLESPRLPKRIERIQGDIAFSPARASITGLDLAAGQSSMTLDATVTRPLAVLAPPGRSEPAGVDFTLRSPHLDLAELLPVTPGAPVLPNVRGQGRVEIARLVRGKLDVTDVRAQVAMTPARLEVPSFSLRGYGGLAHGGATFDLTAPQRPAFDLKAQLDSVQADALLSAWTPARGLVHGALNSTMSLAGQGTAPMDVARTLTAVGMAVIGNGSLGPAPALESLARSTGLAAFKEPKFRDLKLPFRVERGRIITDPVSFEGPTGHWQLTGGLGFDGQLDYAVSVTLPPDVVAGLDGRAALAAGALSDDKGNLLLDLRVTGPARAPRVTLDARAMRERVAGKLSHILLDQRSKLEDQVRAALAGDNQGASDSAQAAADKARRSARDSLARTAQDLLKGLFGGGKKDTTKH